MAHAGKFWEMIGMSMLISTSSPAQMHPQEAAYTKQDAWAAGMHHKVDTRDPPATDMITGRHLPEQQEHLLMEHGPEGASSAPSAEGCSYVPRLLWMAGDELACSISQPLCTHGTIATLRDSAVLKLVLWQYFPIS